MKRVLSVFLVIVLALGLQCGAWAETTIFDAESGVGGSEWTCEEIFTLDEGLDVEDLLDVVPSIIVFSREDWTRSMISPDGAPLLDGMKFDSIDRDYEVNYYCKVSRNEKKGAVIMTPETGLTLISPVYDEINVHNADWAYGMTFRDAAEGEESDYWSLNGKEYVVSATDLYYQGTKVAELDEQACCGSYRDEFCGDYCCIFTRDGVGVWYNKNGEKTGFTSDYYSVDEYNEKLIHQATGEKAFVPGCTLTADEVAEAYVYIDNFSEDSGFHNGDVLDLQGNVLFTLDSATCEAMEDSEVVFTGNVMELISFEDTQLILFDMEGNKLVEVISDENEEINEVLIEGDSLIVSTLDPESYEDKRIIFANLTDGKMVAYTLTEGYKLKAVSARYAVAQNETTEDNLLYSMSGIVDLENYETSEDRSQELLIVHKMNNYVDKLLIDFEGHIVSEDCDFLSLNGKLFAAGNTIYSLSK